MTSAGAAVLDLGGLLATAHALADAADAIATSAFRRPLRVESKPDGTPVTEADRAIEAEVRRLLGSAHPRHAVLGEEEGGAIERDVPTWVLDPIDGTKSFLRGLPMFATLIAVVVRGEPVVGVASAPALGERWAAARGLGATCNGEPVGVSRVPVLDDAHVLHGGIDWWRREPGAWEKLGVLADRSWRMRGFGDWWMHALVAGGMADVAAEYDVRPWDVAALQCIVGEAGGRVTSCTGGDPLVDGSILSSNGTALHDEVLAVLRG